MRTKHECDAYSLILRSILLHTSKHTKHMKTVLEEKHTL